MPRISVPEPGKIIDLTRGMISHWKFNDNTANTDVIDSYGVYDLACTANSFIVSDTGKVNESFDLNSTYYCKGFQIPYLNPNLSDLTICLWFKDRGGAGVKWIHDFSCDAGTTHISLIRNGGILEASVYASGGFQSNASGAFSQTNWNHVFLIWRYEQKVLEMYIANTKQTGTNFNGSFTNPGGLEQTFVGVRADESSGTEWDGWVDEFRTYTRVLSESERNGIYNNGNGTEVQVSATNPSGGKLVGAWFNPRVPHGQDYSPTGDDGVIAGGAKFDKDGIFNSIAVTGYMTLSNACAVWTHAYTMSTGMWIFVPQGVGVEKYIVRSL